MPHPGVPYKRILLLAAALVLAAVPAWWGLQGNGSFTASVDDPPPPRTTAATPAPEPLPVAATGSPSALPAGVRSDAEAGASSAADRSKDGSAEGRGGDDLGHADAPAPSDTRRGEAGDDRGGSSGSGGTSSGPASGSGGGTETGRGGAGSDDPSGPGDGGDDRGGKGSGGGSSSGGSGGGAVRAAAVTAVTTPPAVAGTVRPTAVDTVAKTVTTTTDDAEGAEGAEGASGANGVDGVDGDPAPAPDGDGWRHLVVAEQSVSGDDVVRPRRVYARIVALSVVVVLVVSVLSALVARRIAEREAINDSARDAALLADTVIEPHLSDGLVRERPAAIAELDGAVRAHLIGDGVVRVKIWRPDGTIVYSDEPRLIGRHFDLGEDERAVLRTPATRAEVTDLDEPENVFERGQGRLLEVYRPVVAPDGQVLLFEMYAPYDLVTDRSGDIWRGFAGLTLTTLMILLVLLLPVVWRLLDRLRNAQGQRERLLRRALDASDDERRRIAAGLHDGVVQELAATSFMVSGAAARAGNEGQSELAQTMDEAAAAVRTGINGLRSLLVDIYPPSLETTGLRQALTDLVEGFAGRGVGIDLRLETPREPDLDRSGRRLLFQIAQETVRNAARHAGATTVTVTLEETDDGCRLMVDDDGVGFDVDAALAAPEHGHFGLRLLLDAARENGADLWVSSRPGGGTTWCAEVRR